MKQLQRQGLLCHYHPCHLIFAKCLNCAVFFRTQVLPRRGTIESQPKSRKKQAPRFCKIARMVDRGWLGRWRMLIPWAWCPCWGNISLPEITGPPRQRERWGLRIKVVDRYWSKTNIFTTLKACVLSLSSPSPKMESCKKWVDGSFSSATLRFESLKIFSFLRDHCAWQPLYWS